jgi:hypothetical protein
MHNRPLLGLVNDRTELNVGTVASDLRVRCEVHPLGCMTPTATP